MKKIIFFLALAGLFFPGCLQLMEAPVTVPDGSKENPFLISTATELANLVYLLNSSPSSCSIKLLKSINYNNGIKVDGITVTIDLNSSTLTVNNPTGNGLEVINGGKLILTDNGVPVTKSAEVTKAAGGGEFDIIGKIGIRVDGVGSVATVHNATGTNYGAWAQNGGTIIVIGDATGITSSGVVALSGGSVTVTGDVMGKLYGAGADGVNSLVTIGGDTHGNIVGAEAYHEGRVIVLGDAISEGPDDVYASLGSYGVIVDSGGSITVSGNATGGDFGALLQGDNSKISVGGNATGTLPETSVGAQSWFCSGKLTVNGNATGCLYGAYAKGDNAKIEIGGNATGDYGAYAVGGGCITVTGDAFGDTYGVLSEDNDTKIEIGGNVITEGTSGVMALNGSTVAVAKDVSGGYFGVYFGGGNIPTVTVGGNVSGDYVGVYASGPGEVTIDGTISSGWEYILLIATSFLQSDGVPSTVKPGYLEYIESTSYVFVKE